MSYTIDNEGMRKLIAGIGHQLTVVKDEKEIKKLLALPHSERRDFLFDIFQSKQFHDPRDLQVFLDCTMDLCEAYDKGKENGIFKNYKQFWNAVGCCSAMCVLDNDDYDRMMKDRRPYCTNFYVPNSRAEEQVCLLAGVFRLFFVNHMGEIPGRT